jgi:hypothetical protein
VIIALAWPMNGWCTEPLHQRIDQLLAESELEIERTLADDAEFLRRVYLDLHGTIPTVDEARAFLAESAVEKRARLVDRLLTDEQSSRHLANVFDVMLMERRAQKHINLDEWQEYLVESFRNNEPWDQLAREILAADGSDERQRPATRFYLARDGDPNLLTRDAARIFFGMDLQCCQCHDHPLIAGYFQADYYGIYAFLNRGFVFTDEKKKVFYAEKAEGDVTFTSVFTEEKGATRPRLPGDFEINEPQFLRGSEYEVAPESKVRPVPKYSRRARFAELTTTGDNRAFNRNIANRLWAHMFGRGLVHPVDLHHPENPPTHPELLALLADEMVCLKYDIRAFMRELALTRVYQQSLQVPELKDVPDHGEALARLAAAHAASNEKIDQSRKTVAEYKTQLSVIEERVAATANQFKEANKKVADALKKSNDADKKLNETKGKLNEKRELSKTLRAAADSATAAAQRIPKDEGLATAAKTFEDRANEYAGTVDQLEKSVDELTIPSEAAAAELSATSAAARTVITQLDQQQHKRENVLRPLRTAANRLAAVEQLSLEIETRRAVAEQIAEIRRHEQKQLELRRQLPEAELQLAAALKASGAIAAKLPAHAAKLTTAQSTAEVAKRSHQDAETQVTAMSDTVGLFTEAATQSQAAASKLPKDTDLKKAAEILQARLTMLQSELEQLSTRAGELKSDADSQVKTVVNLEQQICELRNQMNEHAATAARCEERISQTKQQLSELDVALQGSRTEWSDQTYSRIRTARLKPLSPEQLASAIIQATGAREQFEEAAEAEVDKKHPVEKDKPADAAKLAERETAKKQILQKKIADSTNLFVRLFAHGAGQPQADFFATVDQALFFANADNVQGWLNPGGNNLGARLNKEQDVRKMAEELYISILTRPPSVEEIDEVEHYLEVRQNAKPEAIKEMAWALLTSVEFRFSH